MTKINKLGMQSGRRDRQVVGGIVVGAAFAAVYSLFVTVAFVVRGGTTLADTGLSLLELIALYFLGGMVGGAVVGWLLPYSHTRVGSILVGIAGALPVFLGLAAAMSSELAHPFGTAVLAAILVGGIVGHHALYKRDRASA